MADNGVIGTAAIVGQGYVGLPVAMRAVEVGVHVVGYDLDAAKIDALRDGRTYIDDVTDDDIAAALASGRYVPSSDAADLAGFDVAVITVPTPLRDGAPDLSFVESAARTVGAHVRSGCTVILESTTYPGTTEEIIAPLLHEESGLTAGVDFHLGYSPERIDPGNRTWTFQRTPKVVSGIDAASARAVQAFYDLLVDETVLVRGTREAEMTKLLENTFRHVNIALVNELTIQAAALGVDIWDVVRAASTKPFGFMPFQPGPGVGGHCLPIDPSYLSWKIEHEVGTPSRFVDTANDVNQQMPRHVVDRIFRGLNERGKPAKGSRILVLGVAYKQNSSDARETPATLVIRGLLGLGADVVAHDTHVEEFELDKDVARIATLDVAELSAADVVVILTAHDDVDYDLVVANAGYVFDARHVVSGDTVEHL
ncbi:MAG: nucleotide sugar dehydrogenase [Actinomycetota bacterium]|nr:nucleotide sugar dehydrogenase [Actinomycetota bacterium]